MSKVLGLILLLALRPSDAGIDGFWKWFKGHYKESVTHVKMGNYAEFDHVLIDVNQLAHMAARKAKSEDQAIRRLLRNIADTLKVLHARKSVVIAFDGPAPLAKIITQRKRRTNEKETEAVLTSLHLSPGTTFMRRAASALISYSKSRIETQAQYRHVKFYVSGTECPGEGEVKLMDWINCFATDPKESLVVVGGDADLVLQGLALPGHLPDFNVYVPDIRRSGSVVSLRHLVDRLEREFPGQSHHVRNDLVLLLVMSGNDYLPKVRGLTFRNKLLTYTKIKRLGEFRDQFLLDPVRRTFNWRFLQELYDDLAGRVYVQDVSKVVQAGPTPAGVLNELFQKKLLPKHVFEFHGKDSEWWCRLDIDGREFVCEEPHATVKAAKHTVSRMALKEFAPEAYNEFFGEGKEAIKSEGAVESVGGEEEIASESEEEEMDEEEDDQVLVSEEEDEEEAVTEEEGESGGWGDGVEWLVHKHKDKHFDEEQYLTGLLWNYQMYNDGYCPDYTFTYRYRFAPSSDRLADWIKSKLASNVNFTLHTPISTRPPLHPWLVCAAVMPSKGLHLVPEDVSRLLRASPRVMSMYKRNGPFSLDLLVRTVEADRPDLVHSNDFSWVEISASNRSKSPPRGKGGKGPIKEGNATKNEDGGVRVIVKRVNATREPPLRAWAKRRHSTYTVSLPNRVWSSSRVDKGVAGGDGNTWSHQGLPGGKGREGVVVDLSEKDGKRRRRPRRPPTDIKAGLLHVAHGSARVALKMRCM